VSLAKTRGFVYPGSEIYGGLANTWDYGPLGIELKNNIKISIFFNTTIGKINFLTYLKVYKVTVMFVIKI